MSNCYRKKNEERRINELNQLSKEELIEIVDKLQRENLGLKQTVENYKRKESAIYDQYRKVY